MTMKPTESGGIRRSFTAQGSVSGELTAINCHPMHHSPFTLIIV